MRIIVGLLAIVCASGIAVAKDLILRQRTATGAPGTPAREETVYIAASKLVSDSAATRTIIDLDTKTITSVDKAKRTFAVMTFDELAAQMEALRQQLAALPPEARKLVGPLFDEAPPIRVTPSGKTETIAGYPASEHLLKGGPYSGSVWATDAIPTPAEFQRWKALEQATGSPGGAGQRLGEAMSSIKGFPLRSRIESKSGGSAFVVSSEVLEVNEASPPAEVMQVPAGFSRLGPTAR
jgi:hypothetical protein